MAYRRKTEAFEAQQYLPLTPAASPTGLYPDAGMALVDASEGPVVLESGDWVLTGDQGTILVMSDTKFQACFEEVPK